MRISDWSSDVCSSDLARLCGQWVEGPLAVARGRRLAAGVLSCAGGAGLIAPGRSRSHCFFRVGGTAFRHAERAGAAVEARRRAPHRLGDLFQRMVGVPELAQALVVRLGPAALAGDTRLVAPVLARRGLW